MELDEMKAAWGELGRRLDESLALDRPMLRRLALDRPRSAIRRLIVAVVFDLACGIAAALLVGSFLADHLLVARYAAPALALHAFAIFLIGSAARQLAMIGGLDYAAPVTSIQRRLAELRASRIFTARWGLLLSPLLWTPLAIVAARGLLGIDLYRAFGVPWIAANLALGAAIIPVVIAIARRLADRPTGARWLARLADCLADRSLDEAKREIDAIAQFDGEG
jgi:hypothetical protein